MDGWMDGWIDGLMDVQTGGGSRLSFQSHVTRATCAIG